MITKDIFDIITKVASYGRTDYEPTPDEVFTALMHGYYYVRPGSDTETFVFALNEVFSDGKHKGNVMFNKKDNTYSLDECIRISTAYEGIAHVISFFDEEYFASQKESMNGAEEYSDVLMVLYFLMSNKDLLKQMLHLVTSLKHVENGVGYFMDEKNTQRLAEELNIKCRIFDDSIPDINMKHEYDSFISDNPDYFFDVLESKDIALSILHNIKKHKKMAGHLSKMAYYYDSSIAREYIPVALYCEEFLGVNPFPRTRRKRRC